MFECYLILIDVRNNILMHRRIIFVFVSFAIGAFREIVNAFRFFEFPHVKFIYVVNIVQRSVKELFDQS